MSKCDALAQHKIRETETANAVRVYIVLRTGEAALLVLTCAWFAGDKKNALHFLSAVRTKKEKTHTLIISF